MPIDPPLLEILRCPKCKGELQYETDPERLTCMACRLRYFVRDEIPVMLVDEAESF